MRHEIAGFDHVLSVSVVPSVSVESAMESCDVSMTCFCAVSSSGTHPSIADFLEHLTAACPRSVTHASQKCPQFCGIGRSWMLNELLHG